MGMTQVKMKTALSELGDVINLWQRSSSTPILGRPIYENRSNQLIAAMLTVPAYGAFAGNGLAVGQNDRLLETTKCANNGKGNDMEYIRIRRSRDGIVEICYKNFRNLSEDHPWDADPAGH